VRLSRRFVNPGAPNAVARERLRLAAAGERLTDLTDSNPTHFGLGSSLAFDAVSRAAIKARLYEPEPKGPRAAREALAAHFGGAPDDYWLTSSTSEAYSWVFSVLTDPGDSIAVPVPGYPLLEPLADLAGLRTLDCRWHYLPIDGWTPDYADFDRAASQDARAYVLVNPGNPTGAYVNEATASAALEACQKTRAALIADEVFKPFNLEGRPTSLAGEDRTVTFAFDGLSKSLCAPQLKLGWIRLSGPADALEPVRAALDQVADTFLSVNWPVALALPELLELADGIVEMTRQRLVQNLTTAKRLLGQDPWRLRRCEGGWTVIVDPPKPSGSDQPEEENTAIQLMRAAQLAIHPGWFYDIAEPGALALSLLPEPPTFEDNCRRLRAAITVLGAE
jgi:aspartate/methionine/tyrosine aminotransferase